MGIVNYMTFEWENYEPTSISWVGIEPDRGILNGSTGDFATVPGIYFWLRYKDIMCYDVMEWDIQM